MAKRKRTCLNCGKELPDVKPSRAIRAKYCNMKCYLEHKKKNNTRVCPTCGKTFSTNKKATIHCSRKCMGKSISKKKRAKKGVTKKTVDDLWALVVKLRAGNKCEYCGKSGARLNSHHIFSRSNMNTRWDLDNGICLCVAHHVFSNMSAHKAPIDFVEWLKEVRGEDWFERLRVKARKVAQQVDRDEVKSYLEQERERLLK